MTENNNNHCAISFDKLNQADLELIEAAVKVLKSNFHPRKHQAGCALRTASGKIYSAVSVESSGYGPCAEVVAIGTAISNSDNHIVSIVAIKKVDENYPVLSPCGNCRQLIIDYAHDAEVILNFEGKSVKAKATDLLPGPYENSLTAIARSSRLSGSQ
jgi:cytidine deaminase